MAEQHNSFSTQTTASLAGKNYSFHSLPKLAKTTGQSLERLPYSLKILLENLLRHEDGSVVKTNHVEAILKWKPKAIPETEIQFTPARVLLQDFTGVPCVADLAAMRTALQRMGGNPEKVNPVQPVDLVVDHSIQVDKYGTPDAFAVNTDLEFQRNRERYEFLKWGQSAFRNFRVAPPATGIVHQVNLEYLAQVAMTRELDGQPWVFPDTVVGTDSHTPMVNGLGVLGWGVGGIEAEAAMLGQPSSMLIPQVVGVRLKGHLKPGTTATDLVLTITEMLRKLGVVGKFVEFFGEGLRSLSIADRATIGNMSPEYGATVGIFPVDAKTIEYLNATSRRETAQRVQAYFQEQGLWHDEKTPQAEYSELVELDLATVEPSLAGPSRPQDRVSLSGAKASFRKALVKSSGKDESALDSVSVQVKDPSGENYTLNHGSIVVAAITSCTNTSNPTVLMTAGLLARNAVKRGLKVKPWVKTSLGPGSRVVTTYFENSGLMRDLEALKFHLVGYGCTVCIGNTGPLPPHISQAISTGNLSVVSVLSGNRNFEARIHSEVRANYLASPPLVVAYALAGHINVDLSKDALGNDQNGEPVYLRDIWPNADEVHEFVQKYVTAKEFEQVYRDVFTGDQHWKSISVPKGNVYEWNNSSTYIQEPPFFQPDQMREPKDIKNARVLLYLGDSVTTDHISPAGSFKSSSDAGQFLQSKGVKPEDFNSYGSRRGNHEVMMRGTFANVRIRNLLLKGVEGGQTIHLPTGKQMSVFAASEKYMAENIPLIILAGKEYGSGSSRDWAAKGPQLLGVQAVIAEGYERIHRSNLIGMGILPLQFKAGENTASLGLDGTEVFEISNLSGIQIGGELKVKAKMANSQVKEFVTRIRIDTPNELAYYRAGGLLPFMLHKLAK